MYTTSVFVVAKLMRKVIEAFTPGLSKNRRERTEHPCRSWRPYRRPDGSTGQPDRWRRER